MGVIATALSIAATMFGPTICGEPHVGFAALPATLVAQADSDRCTITYNSSSSLSAYDVCYATVHEYGHLTGLGHSPDPHSVMYPVEEPGFAPCQRFA